VSALLLLQPMMLRLKSWVEPLLLLLLLLKMLHLKLTFLQQ
jgi:hypothetical protein